MTRRLQPGEMPLLAFTVLYVVAGAVAIVVSKNYEFLIYLGVMLVLAGAVYAAYRKIKPGLPILWGFSIWGLLHLAGGLVPVPESWPIGGPVRVLYSLWFVEGWLKYDQAVHAFGFFLTALFCWRGLETAFKNRGSSSPGPTPGLLTLAGAAGMGFGALNEVIEFLAVVTVPETNVGGYFNTGWDLVFNLIGVLLAVLWIRFRTTRDADGTTSAAERGFAKEPRMTP